MRTIFRRFVDAVQSGAKFSGHLYYNLINFLNSLLVSLFDDNVNCNEK